ncbi:MULTISPECIES: hypothetical protein [unclassified Bradyrhizobium]|uniref:hypothetical protein n=1 Tax=unclassified Bradyrhizobium TaxID=2631580 RepID=UPI001FFF28C3|nr:MULTISPECIES: hypothetical protein [unclassified Bradyrhizobium]
MTRIDLTRRQAIAGSLAASVLASTGGGAVESEPKTLARRRLKVGISGFPRSFDPVIATDTAIRRVMPQLFDTLIRVDHAHNDATAGLGRALGADQRAVVAAVLAQGSRFSRWDAFDG